MKRILFAIVLFASCKTVSKQEEASIKALLDLHNINAKQRFHMKRINNQTFIEVAALNKPESEKASWIAHADSMFVQDYFATYNMSLDTALTYDKYMEFCDKRKVSDRVKYLDDIDPSKLDK